MLKSCCLPMDIIKLTISYLSLFIHDGESRRFDLLEKNPKYYCILPSSIRLFYDAIAIHNNDVFLSGGCNPTNYVTSNVSHYNILCPSSSMVIANMQQPRMSHAMIYSHNRLFVLGGVTCEYYDFLERTWHYLPSMHEKRDKPLALTCQNRIYVFDNRSCEYYDIGNNVWYEIANVPDKTAFPALGVAILDRYILLLGHIDVDTDKSTRVWIYTIATNIWSLCKWLLPVATNYFNAHVQFLMEINYLALIHKRKGCWLTPFFNIDDVSLAWKFVPITVQ